MNYFIVDLHKGCYIGQEFIMRTEKSGIVRKRILPFIAIDKEKKRQEEGEGEGEKNPSIDEKERQQEVFLSRERRGFEGISHGSEIMSFYGSETAVKERKGIEGEREKEENIVNIKSDNVIGKFICMNGNMGLSMIRLDRWNKKNIPYYIHRPDPSSMDDYLAIQPFVPEWWPPKMT